MQTVTRVNRGYSPEGWDAAVPHVLDVRQFHRSWLEEVLFPEASGLQRMERADLPPSLSGKRLFYLFYEPSTRTRVSFETAVSLLGGSVSGMEEHESSSQAERLEDRVQVINQYPYDFLLLRSREEGGARRAAAVSRIPIINAGDGAGQHPTQALLDAYTLWRERGGLDGLRIALVGDLSYERSTNSLAYLLAQFRDVTVYLVAPQLLRMREDVRAFLLERGVHVQESRDLRRVAGELDALYVTRSHTARLEHAMRFDNGEGHYTVDAAVMAALPGHARVLHPLPRGPELPPDFDADERIACFRQAGNGVYVRMALLRHLAQHTGAGASGSGAAR